MPKVGDHVRVSIKGNTILSGTATSIALGEGASIDVPGEIIEDRGNHWLIKLNISFGGKDRLLVPKDAFKVTQR